MPHVQADGYAMPISFISSVTCALRPMVRAA